MHKKDLSHCMGHLELAPDGKLVVDIHWHLIQELSIEYRREFLKQRCVDAREAFGICEGAKVEPLLKTDKPEFTVADLTYRWPIVKKEEWESIKQRFMDLFEVARLRLNRGGINDQGDKVTLIGEFLLDEKGAS